MSQESALTPEEIEAMDQDVGTPEQQPIATQADVDSAADRLRTASQEPEARS
jgi:hypothetical protein